MTLVYEYFSIYDYFDIVFSFVFTFRWNLSFWIFLLRTDQNLPLKKFAITLSGLRRCGYCCLIFS